MRLIRICIALTKFDMFLTPLAKQHIFFIQIVKNRKFSCEKVTNCYFFLQKSYTLRSIPAHKLQIVTFSCEKLHIVTFFHQKGELGLHSIKGIETCRLCHCVLFMSSSLIAHFQWESELFVILLVHQIVLWWQHCL